MSKFAQWMQNQAPSRESFERSRFLRPFANRVFHPSLWRFNRRSVPRGVALGLLVGIFLLIPGVQIAGVALLALPVRANIPIGAAMTFLSMPLTTPLILLASAYIGGADATHLMAILDAKMAWWPKLIELSYWLLSDAAPAMLFGLLTISVVSAAIGYVLATWFWRWRISRKWQQRAKAHHISAE
jgi:uncharacterized protein (DUF2062 family)